MALNKLRGELKSIGVTQNEAAELLGMTASNFNRKLAEAVPFTRDEMFTIRDEYFPETSIDYLFQSDGDEMRRAKPGDGEIAEIEDMFHEYVGEWERQYPQEAVETA